MLNFVAGLVLIIANLAILFQLIDQIFDTDQSVFVKILLVLICVLCLCLIYLGVRLLFKPLCRAGKEVIDAAVDIFDSFDVGD